MKTDKKAPFLKRVLIVDDDPFFSAYLKSLLELELEISINLAGSGKEALEYLAAVSVAAVVSDMGMPGMNGAELLRHIREKFPSLPVIMLSGNFDATGVRPGELLALGATGVLAKDETSKKLVPMVAHLLSVPVRG